MDKEHFGIQSCESLLVLSTPMEREEEEQRREGEREAAEKCDESNDGSERTEGGEEVGGKGRERECELRPSHDVLNSSMVPSPLLRSLSRSRSLSLAHALTLILKFFFPLLLPMLLPLPLFPFPVSGRQLHPIRSHRQSPFFLSQHIHDTFGS